MDSQVVMRLACAAICCALVTVGSIVPATAQTTWFAKAACSAAGTSFGTLSVILAQNKTGEEAQHDPRNAEAARMFAATADLVKAAGKAIPSDVAAGFLSARRQSKFVQWCRKHYLSAYRNAYRAAVKKARSHPKG